MRVREGFDRGRLERTERGVDTRHVGVGRALGGVSRGKRFEAVAQFEDVGARVRVLAEQGGERIGDERRGDIRHHEPPARHGPDEPIGFQADQRLP